MVDTPSGFFGSFAESLTHRGPGPVHVGSRQRFLGRVLGPVPVAEHAIGDVVRLAVQPVERRFECLAGAICSDQNGDVHQGAMSLAKAWSARRSEPGVSSMT